MLPKKVLTCEMSLVDANSLCHVCRCERAQFMILSLPYEIFSHFIFNIGNVALI